MNPARSHLLSHPFGPADRKATAIRIGLYYFLFYCYHQPQQTFVEAFSIHSNHFSTNGRTNPSRSSSSSASSFVSHKNLASVSSPSLTIGSSYNRGGLGDFDDDDDGGYVYDNGDGAGDIGEWGNGDSNLPVSTSSAVKKENLKQQSSLSSTTPSSHFFSRKTLNDPSFRLPTTSADSAESKLLFDELCRRAGIARPSKIQSLAWPVVSQGKHTLIADQTGSGKTLAYLIPLLQRKFCDEKANHKRERINGAPTILILAPTAELADQIRAVCDKLSSSPSSTTSTAKFSTMVVSSQGAYSTLIRDQIRMIQRQPIDVMISTPGRISTILRSKNSGGLDLSHLQALVLDEVDVLLMDDDTFGPQLRTVGAATPVEQTQFVFVTATLPDSIVDTVQKEFPNVALVKGPGLHRIAPTLTEHLIDVSVPAPGPSGKKYVRDTEFCFDIKAQELLKALRQTRCERTLIFCNTVESCRDVENFLNRQDRKGQLYNVFAYHSAMTPESRNANLAAFIKGPKNDAVGTSGTRGKSKNSQQQADVILVCTDRAARGVDFDASPVDHVLIFDFPKDPAEYVRRVGRTARAGQSGTSTVFAYGWQLPIARSVMGKKLENFATTTAKAFDDRDSDDKENYEYRGGASNRRKKGATKTASMKDSIEKGKMW